MALSKWKFVFSKGRFGGDPVNVGSFPIFIASAGQGKEVSMSVLGIGSMFVCELAIG